MAVAVVVVALLAIVIVVLVARRRGGRVTAAVAAAVDSRPEMTTASSTTLPAQAHAISVREPGVDVPTGTTITEPPTGAPSATDLDTGSAVDLGNADLAAAEPMNLTTALESEPQSASWTVGGSVAPLEPNAIGEIGWYRQFDPRSSGLDDTARLRLIGDLGVIAGEWCVPLLCDAYREEQRPANRQAALVALTACRSQNAVATYRLALASDHLAERAIATDALADLEPARATRTIVERL